MGRAIAVIAFCVLLSGAAAAQTTAPEVCTRPSAPLIPERAAPGLTLGQLIALHDARDAYVAAADQYRLCLDRDIEQRRDAMFRANAPLDPVLDLRAREHSDISAERAHLMGRFVLMCLSWEDANGIAYPRGCYLPG